MLVTAKPEANKTDSLIVTFDVLCGLSCPDQQEEEEQEETYSLPGQHAHHHRLSRREAFSIPARGGYKAYDGEGEGGGLQHGVIHGEKPAPAATWHQMAGPLCWHW